MWLCAGVLACRPASQGVPEGLSPPQAAFERPRRIFLVTIDTLRADHLSFYGYPRETAPFLSELAESSAVFERMIASSSHTAPSHVSLFTGLQVPQHRVRMNRHRRMDPAIETLTQTLAKAGYRTAGRPSVPFLGLLERGFESFEVPPAPPPEAGAPYSHSPATAMVDSAIAWLDRVGAEEPFFLWLHLFDPHQPRDAPPERVEAMMRTAPAGRLSLLEFWISQQHKTPEVVPGGRSAFGEWQDRYDAAVAYADAELRRLYEAARARGQLGESLWIVTADHGEGLGSHGYPAHGRELYQEQVRVPFLVHHPDGGLVRGRVRGVAHHVDLHATLAEMVGAPLDSAHPSPGRSLLPLLKGEASAATEAGRVVYSERRERSSQGYTRTWSPDPVYAVQDERFKYLVRGDGHHEFYALAEDPHELENLVGRGHPEESRWRALAEAEHRRLGASADRVAPPEVSDEDRDALRALGYVE